jgi:Bacterioferritin (cytochrome b1)
MTVFLPYRAAIKHAESVQDYGSRDLLASLLADEEGHVDFLETQLDMIDRMGLENYCQLQSTGGEEAGE